MLVNDWRLIGDLICMISMVHVYEICYA